MLESEATFSPDGLYRYRLARYFNDKGIDGKMLLFIMLNPSTADAVENDPTVTRCINYAKEWGFDGLIVGNVYAYRSTDPKGMKAVPDPVGPENEAYLCDIHTEASMTVCAWGRHGISREYRIKELLDGDLWALKLTHDGHPQHPLYQKANLEPVLWRPAYKHGG